MLTIATSFFTVVGIITCIYFVGTFILKRYRKRYGYSWNDCPKDHDAMARYGFEGRCDTCFNYIGREPEDDDDDEDEDDDGDWDTDDGDDYDFDDDEPEEDYDEDDEDDEDDKL